VVVTSLACHNDDNAAKEDKEAVEAEAALKIKKAPKKNEAEMINSDHNQTYNLYSNDDITNLVHLFLRRSSIFFINILI